MSQPGPSMGLENIRRLGVRMLTVTCATCGLETDVNVERYPGDRDVHSFASFGRAANAAPGKAL